MRERKSSQVRILVTRQLFGSMVERFIALVLKTRDLNGSVGSNPTTSAKKTQIKGITSNLKKLLVQVMFHYDVEWGER